MTVERESSLVVRLKREIRATPECVWEVIGTFEGLLKWLAVRTFEPRIGGRTLFDAEHEGKRWLMFGTVATFDAARELAFTWREVDTQKLTVWPADTLVRVVLTPQENGTLVELIHSGFEALSDAQEQYAGYSDGWASLNDLEELARMCEAQ